MVTTMLSTSEETSIENSGDSMATWWFAKKTTLRPRSFWKSSGSSTSILPTKRSARLR
jgi:hypothetical protein